jgi:1,4-dihydroxy-6-naphthoate synthase
VSDRPLLTIAYTPDSDDAFYYDALEAGHVRLSGFRLRFYREPMARLNAAAREGRYDVTAVSSVVYPMVADRYAILSAGNSVGRGYGPVLVSRDNMSAAELAGRRVGVPGIPTTGWFLLRALCPDAVVVEMQFDRIAEAVVAGELAAGVMIHEELLYYPRLGLRRVADLGAWWCDKHGLPLPVGLNLVCRDLGAATMSRICGAIQTSLDRGRAKPLEALARVSRWGRGPAGGCTEQFVAMFANDDSRSIHADVRDALRVLFCQVVDQGLAPARPPIDIVDAPRREPALRRIA